MLHAGFKHNLFPLQKLEENEHEQIHGRRGLYDSKSAMEDKEVNSDETNKPCLCGGTLIFSKFGFSCDRCAYGGYVRQSPAASNTGMVDSKVSTINDGASNTVSFFNVANLIVSTLKYDYLRKLPAYRVDEIRARIELALSEVASLKDKRIAELEARNAELRDANAEVLRDKMELEAKLQTAVKRNTKLEKELERVLSDWDADRGRKLYLEKQLKTAEDKLAEVTKEKEDHPYNRNCGCILCRNH